MSATAISAQGTSWNVIGYKCYICYSNYDQGVNHQSSDYRQRVMESCADTLFSEITGDEFDWNLIICNEVLPFCQNCWQAIEKIYDLNQHKEAIESSIEDIVKELATKILSNRKYLKKKGVLSTSKTNPIPASFGDGIKIEGFSVNQNIKCKMCHNVYMVGETNNLLSLDIAGKVMECCELHLFPELIDEGFFDWNSIPFNNYVPFCEDCSQDVKNIMHLDEKLKDTENFISTNVDMFTLNVLKCRRSLKKMGRHGFRNKGGYRDDSSCASSLDSQDTIDLDEDCQIINVASTDVYPNNFAETTLQEPPGQFMEQPNHSVTPSTSNGYRDGIHIEETMPLLHPESSMKPGYSNSFESDATRPNSAETCVVTPSPQPCSSSSSFTNIKSHIVVEHGGGGQRNIPGLSAALKMSINENNIIASSQQVGNTSVTIARLPQQSGSLFKCHSCQKIFIFRKCWEAHEAECVKPGASSAESAPAVVQTCCDKTFADEESWDIHRVSHRSQTFMPAQKKNTKTTSPVRIPAPAIQIHYSPPPPPPVRSNFRERRRSQSQIPEEYPPFIPLEYQCSYCDKSCQTKKGLNLHMHSHTKTQTYKCRKCPEAFGYPSQLTKHYRVTHAEKKTPNKSRAPPKPKSYKSLPENNLPMISKKRRLNFSCRFCPMPIYNKRDLIDHVQSHYDIAGGCRCEICKMVLSSKTALKTHNHAFHKHLC